MTPKNKPKQTLNELSSQNTIQHEKFEHQNVANTIENDRFEL